MAPSSRRWQKLRSDRRHRRLKSRRSAAILPSDLRLASRAWKGEAWWSRPDSGEPEAARHFALPKRKLTTLAVDVFTANCVFRKSCRATGMARRPFSQQSNPVLGTKPVASFRLSSFFEGFPVFPHSLPSLIRHVLFFLATYWPFGN